MPAKLSLSQSLDRIERHLNKMWRSDEVASRFMQLSFNEYDYLQTVQQLEQARLSDIASMMRVSKPSASNMISKLERRGLLKRAASPDDGRVVLVSLSDEGKTLMALDNEIFDRFTQRIKQQMKPADYQTLEHLLAQMCEQL
ncbi:MarR family winged helix-turn-helix transcriptional regulator [Endozoicomonas sp.]|uniref:MarR family winged helix-turn-helix transcriptional regulator n=1 Tax=Endozoicomonas sp. TaxID=1892382 RepID=UPI002884D984|nr:MarR family transcriptional regulator [Endozoicomonas sp.]